MLTPTDIYEQLCSSPSAADLISAICKPISPDWVFAIYWVISWSSLTGQLDAARAPGHNCPQGLIILRLARKWVTLVSITVFLYYRADSFRRRGESLCAPNVYYCMMSLTGVVQQHELKIAAIFTGNRPVGQGSVRKIESSSLNVAAQHDPNRQGSSRNLANRKRKKSSISTDRS